MDIIITQTIPSDKVEKALKGYLGLFPNMETIDDPSWEDPEDGTEAPQIAKYTDKQWVDEKQDRLLRQNIKRGLIKIAMNEARKSISVDDEIVS